MTSDITAPSLIGYDLSTYEVDLSSGDVTIDVTAQINDDISGVFDGTYANGSGGSASQARWRSPSGNQFLDAGYFSTPSTGNPLNGIYTDQTVLDSNSERGTWSLEYFLVADEAGNIAYLSKEQVDALGIKTTFEVTGGGNDVKAPSLTSYNLSSYTIDLSSGDVTIDVTAKISDDISGVSDGTYANGSGGGASQARWRSPSGNQFLDAGYFTTPSSGNSLNGTYTDQTVLDANSERGTWSLEYFLLGDEAGNSEYLSKEQVDALGIKTTFEVTGGGNGSSGGGSGGGGGAAAPSSSATTNSIQSIENTVVNGRSYLSNGTEALTNQANINIGLLGGNDFLEVTGGSNNFANGNNGEDHIVLRGGQGKYLGGNNNDKIEVFSSGAGSWVNGNNGTDFITGSVDGMIYRGGADDDRLAVSAGSVWGDKGADTFQATAGAGVAFIQDYTAGLDKVQGVAGGGFSLTDQGLAYGVGGDQMLLLLGITDASQVTVI